MSWMNPLFRLGICSFHVQDGTAGWLALSWGGEWNLHLLVRPSSWVWGYKATWYDGVWKSFGFGPLFLLCWGPD